MLREDCLKRLQDGCLSDILVFAVKSLEIQRSSAGQDVKFLREYTISTHAPAGGATVHTAEEMRRVRISTHAPAGGATIPELIEKYGLTQFLLTPLREGRPLH